MRYAGYTEELLEEIFITKNLHINQEESQRITLRSVYEYVSSLQDSVKAWYTIFNPQDSDFSADIVLWLDKLSRIGMDSYLPFTLIVLQKTKSEKQKAAYLKTIERNLFVFYFFSHYFGGQYGSVIDPQGIDLAIDLHTGKASLEKIIKVITEKTTAYVSHKSIKTATAKFKMYGFYEWPHIRYFLYEHNLHLQEGTKTDRANIFWPEFIEQGSDFITVEHIYPQQARHPYWTERFGGINPKQRVACRNSLGNLLPLSKRKNSSLSNKPFLEKVAGADGSLVSYRYGSYAEKEVAELEEWTPTHVLKRGKKLLDFLETRWDIKLGGEEQKAAMLSMNFPILSVRKNPRAT